MKILHITPYKIVPPNSGGERAIFFLLEALSKRCELLTYTLKENEAQTPFDKLIKLSSSKFRYVNPFFIFSIRRILRQGGYKVLFIEHPYIALFPALFKKLLPVALVIRSHNIEFDRFKTIGKWYWPVIRFIEKYVHTHADVSFFITEEDLQHAIKSFGLQRKKCSVLPYGVSLQTLPPDETVSAAREQVRQTHELGNAKILLFNGSLAYAPNSLAVKHIIEQLIPHFEKFAQNWVVLICGKGLPVELEDLLNQTQSVIYAGFVEDIERYFLACDVFINPVVEGGGVKTKLIEALGFGKKVVSYQSGSYGAVEKASGGRLKIIPDYEAEQFALSVETFFKTDILNDNAAFYQMYNWNHIATQMLATLQERLL